MKQIKIITALLLAVLMFSGFWSGQNIASAQKKRIDGSQETLWLLYKHSPKAKEILESSYGYATFNNVGVHVFVLSGEGGKGLAKVNGTGETTYMNMASAGVGLGFGVKDFRIVFLFEDKKTFDYFVEHGWEANAQADVAAKAGADGKALNAAVTVAPGMRIYKLTQNGLALQASIQGTKYWADNDLN